MRLRCRRVHEQWCQRSLWSGHGPLAEQSAVEEIERLVDQSFGGEVLYHHHLVPPAGPNCRQCGVTVIQGSATSFGLGQR